MEERETGRSHSKSQNSACGGGIEKKGTKSTRGVPDSTTLTMGSTKTSGTMTLIETWTARLDMLKKEEGAIMDDPMILFQFH